MVVNQLFLHRHMPRLQTEATQVMVRAFERVERSLPAPVRVAHKGSFVLRYANKGIREALVQKLARYVSGLHAVAHLLKGGFVQECGVLFRTLDEMFEDIFFLATAETNGGRTVRHVKYLEAFYADPIFTRPEGSLEMPKPNLVPRKKVRAHSVNVLGTGVDQSSALAASEGLSTAYSGFVHAASENIMDMCGGDPPRFHVQGLLGTPRVAQYACDAENYVYRGLMATTAVAKAFGDKPLVDQLHAFIAEYEAVNGHEPPSRH